jgi:hypothetical protein
MHIPRQSDGSTARPTVRAAGAAELRARRRHLVGQLRSVGYWLRLVQARTDLSVAGLLYTAPVPAAVPARRPWDAAGPVGTDDGDADLSGLAAPPEGVDVQRLLGAACQESPGAHLERLREVTLVLVRRSRALQESSTSSPWPCTSGWPWTAPRPTRQPTGTAACADDSLGGRGDDHAALA